MSRYLPTVRTSDPAALTDLQPGQWIDYNGSRGRYYGRRNGVMFIAWTRAARGRKWPVFANVARGSN